MPVSVPRLAAKTAAVLVVAGGLAFASTSAASAKEIVIIDNGHQCSAVQKLPDGSYTNWWR